MEQLETYELISHAHLADCTMFLVDLLYRPMHLHRELELCYVLEGCATVSNRTERFSVTAGDLMLFDAGRAHEICAESGGIRLLAVQISDQFCRRYCPQRASTHFVPCRITDCFSPHERTQFRDTLFRAYHAYLGDGAADLFECLSQLCHMFALLLLHVPSQQPGNAASASRTRNEERLCRILQYLEAHFREPVRLTELAAQENLTETYLSHFFREHLHVTFQDYLTHLRLEAAMYLLKNTAMPMSDIAFECGFSDPKYLKQSFFKRFGVSPQSWRQAATDQEPDLLQSSPYTLQRFLSAEESRALLAQHLHEQH